MVYLWARSCILSTAGSPLSLEDPAAKAVGSDSRVLCQPWLKKTFAARPQGAEVVLRSDSHFQGLTELAEAWNLVMVVS